MKKENSSFDRIGAFIRNSVTLKLLTVTLLMLFLLIPASMISDIIREREQLSESAVQEVSDKWAKVQQIKGPILSIPVTYESEENGQIITREKDWHILPETLDVTGNIEPERLKRGIFEVVVYSSDIKLSGNFMLPNPPSGSSIKAIHYDQAFITIGISDLRGIKNDAQLKWNGQKLQLKAGSRIQDLIYTGVSVDLPNLSDTTLSSFELDLDLQGSRAFSIIPVGSMSKVKLQSPWTAPSFNGNFLPDDRQVNEQGFSAHWSVSQLNRNFPQSWVGNQFQSQMHASSFGVDLISPLDDYQKSHRSAKYAGMIIALTFLIFFLVEVMNKKRIHPFQYALVGLALCLFYTLLVSLSEQLSFNLAYGISTLAIVTMVGFYSKAVFKKIKLSLLMIASLGGLYGFIFVTLQLSDYALLMGSVGLLIILATTMYFTRNIDWYAFGDKDDQAQGDEITS